MARPKKPKPNLGGILDLGGNGPPPETRHANIPAGVIRQMWSAKAGGNIFHAYLVAAKELGL